MISSCLHFFFDQAIYLQDINVDEFDVELNTWYDLQSVAEIHRNFSKNYLSLYKCVFANIFKILPYQSLVLIVKVLFNKTFKHMVSFNRTISLKNTCNNLY